MDFDISPILRWGWPALITVVVFAIAHWIVARTLANQPNYRLYRQLIQLILIGLAMITLVLALPLDPQTRGQLLSLFGLVVTAVIALSSTTFVSNAMAGVTLKVIGSFHTGDFIQVGDHFGRVRTKTLLHTEIQSEDRDTVTLPNMYLVNNPVKVVDQTGTLISADVSIGYDVHREKVRGALLNGATEAGLKDPFVQILELGNFAVGYRVTGFLSDVSTLVSKRTELRALVLDALHQEEIEVMTPSVMAQRPLPADQAVQPEATLQEIPSDFVTGKAERQMFDKADMAARIEKIRKQCETLRDELKTLEAEDKEANAANIAWRQDQLRAQEAFLAQLDQQQG